MDELIYGINPVAEGLRGVRRRPLELLLVRGAGSARLAQLASAAGRVGVPVRYRERRDLDRLVGHGHHQGAVLRTEPFAYTEFEDLLQSWRASGRPAFFLLIDGVTDPHNLGAILRSADAAGCQGVVVAKDRACPVTAVVDRASAGALERISLCRVTNMARTLDRLKAERIWVYGLAGEDGATSLFRQDVLGDLALVVGSEGSGLRPNVRRHCDGLLAIPMAGGVGSLNVSVAAGIALFEVLRRRLAEGEGS